MLIEIGTEIQDKNVLVNDGVGYVTVIELVLAGANIIPQVRAEFHDMNSTHLKFYQVKDLRLVGIPIRYL